MNARVKKGASILITAVLILAMVIQSFAAPLSYAKPAATGSEPARVTGTWNKDAAGNWSFKSKDGTAKDGWYYLNTTNNGTAYNWFYFNKDGVMNTGWIQDKKDPSVWYYAGEAKDGSEGGLVKGWVTDPRDGKRYYMDPSSGAMSYGWQKVDGVWYYFGEKQYENATHPFGAMYVNEKTPDGYYVGSNGAWQQNTSSGSSSSSSRKPDPVPVPEEKKIIADILPDDFPCDITKEEVYEVSGAWKVDGSNNKFCAIFKENKISFQDKAESFTRSISLDNELTKDGNSWKYTTDGGTTYSFNMENGSLVSITVTGSPRDINGTYAPVVITVADILPENFPTASNSWGKDADAWTTENGNKCYIYSGELYFLSIENTRAKYRLNNKVEESGSDYIVHGTNYTITFHMTEDVLTSITHERNASSTAGTYAPAAPAPETKTVAQILKTVEGFPTSDENAWKNDSAGICYIKDKNLRFNFLKVDKYLPLTTAVSGSGNSFNCSDDDATFTFNMTEGKLTSIGVEGTTQNPLDGTYEPPAAQMPALMAMPMPDEQANETEAAETKETEEVIEEITQESEPIESKEEEKTKEEEKPEELTQPEKVGTEETAVKTETEESEKEETGEEIPPAEAMPEKQEPET